MEQIIQVGSYIIQHYAEIIAAINALLLGLIAVFSLIKGDQPEKTLQAIVDFIAKFSRK